VNYHQLRLFSKLTGQKNMKNQKNTEPQYVTKEILKKELSKWEGRLTGKIESLDTKIDGVEQRLDTKINSVEQRLDAKIDGVEQRLDAKIDAKVDSAVQSMKDYTDSRFTQLDTKIDGLAQNMETRFDKFEHYFEELTGMFVKQNKKIDSFLNQLKNHEHRITKLEQHSV